MSGLIFGSSHVCKLFCRASKTFNSSKILSSQNVSPDDSRGYLVTGRDTFSSVPDSLRPTKRWQEDEEGKERGGMGPFWYENRRQVYILESADTFSNWHKSALIGSNRQIPPNFYSDVRGRKSSWQKLSFGESTSFMKNIVKFPMIFLLHGTNNICQIMSKYDIAEWWNFVNEKCGDGHKWQDVFIARIPNWAGLVSRTERTNKCGAGWRYPAYFFVPDIAGSTHPIEQQFVSWHNLAHGGLAREHFKILLPT